MFESTDNRVGLSLATARRAARIPGGLALAVTDALLILGAYAVVLVLRFDGHVPTRYADRSLRFIPVAIGIHLVANFLAGAFRPLWRHASINDAQRVIAAGLASTIALSILFLGATPLDTMPISVVVLGGVLSIALTGLMRFQSRLLAFHRRSEDEGGLRVLVVGAGETAASVIREMRRDRASGMVPVAAVDDDPRTRGRSILGVPVRGSLSDIHAVAESTRAHQVLLAITGTDQELRRRVLDGADAAGIPLKTVPQTFEVGNVFLRDIRDLRIDELLGREEVETDFESVLATVGGKRVLITGAGGSIGSEISRQVASLAPAALILLDHDETHLHDVQQSIDGGSCPVLADIRDAARMFEVFQRFAPEVVFHAAAHKHVPMLEAHPREAFLTNIRGTRNVVDAARKVGVERFVFISTDKAVEPANILGASKYLGELATLVDGDDSMVACAVRFGNVLGSRGSVVPTFMRQIEAGGPITVTDARMTRYFMSIEEAVRLVLQAAALSRGGEIFVLDMGEPVRIVDLADRMARLSGRVPGKDIEIKEVGARPGEKIHEVLVTGSQALMASAHSSILYLKPGLPPAAKLHGSLCDLSDLVAGGDEESTARAIKAAAKAFAVEPSGRAQFASVAD